MKFSPLLPVIPDGKFWCVFNATRGGLPTVFYKDVVKAGNEASRLAGKQPGEVFVVFEAVGTALGSVVVENNVLRV